MNEIEYKFSVASHDDIIVLLERENAELIEYVEQTDHFFDWPDGRIRRGDACFRLRVIKYIDTSQQHCRITYKGPRVDSAAKVRPEYETTLGDFDTMKEILVLIGLAESMVIQKRRKSYRVDDCRVELDELPHIGRFVEIEGPSVDAITKVKKRLAPAAEHISKSYSRLLREFCETHGIDSTRIVF